MTDAKPQPKPESAGIKLALVREPFTDDTGRAWAKGDAVTDGDVLAKIIAEGHETSVIVLNPFGVGSPAVPPDSVDQGA